MRRRQEERHLGDFLRRAEAAERNPTEHLRIERILRESPFLPVPTRKLDRPWRDAVDAYSFARECRSLARREVDHRGLDRGISRRAQRWPEARDRRNVDD